MRGLRDFTLRDNSRGMKSKTHSVADIVKALGGPSKTASALGISNPSVIINWRKRNSIPAQYVVAVAKLTNIPEAEIRPDIFGVAA